MWKVSLKMCIKSKGSVHMNNIRFRNNIAVATMNNVSLKLSYWYYIYLIFVLVNPR